MTTLLVATAGGHLTQLALIAERMSLGDNALWVSGDHPQVDSLLEGREVIRGHFPDTRHVGNALRNFRLARRVLREHDVDRVISTGAGVAVPFLVAAAMRGISAHYVESATRVWAPSLSGRILERVPRVHCYSQYPHWVRRGWSHGGSVLDGFQRLDGDGPPSITRALVTLGTHDYPFDALVDRVRELLDDDVEITWQLGATVAPPDLPGVVHESLPFERLVELIDASDVVISHAGTGSIVTALEAGKVPVVVPRRQQRREHVDDHQLITANEVRSRGLGEVADVTELDREALERAASGRIDRDASRPFGLIGSSVVRGPLNTPAEWRRRIARRLAFADTATLAAAALIASNLRRGLGDQLGAFVNEVPIVLMTIPLWLVALTSAGAYRSEYLNSGGDAFRRFSLGVTVGVLTLPFVSFLFELRLSRAFVLFFVAVVVLVGGGVRFAVRSTLARRFRSGQLRQRVLVAGTDADARRVAEVLDASEQAPYEVVGHLRDGTVPDPPDGGPWSVVGDVDEALPLAYEHGVGLVVASAGSLSPGRLRDLIVALEGSPVDLAVAPSLFEVVSRRMTIETVNNTPLLHVDQIRLARGRAFAKRSLDLVVASVLLVLALPVMLLAGLAVRLDSPGEVLFRQRRVGKDGVPFTILKFRTMVQDAEARLYEVEHLNEVGHGFFKVREDPRITRTGRFLRKWSIDELPQLWNVIRGDMAMVGPRPPIPSEVAEYEPWQRRRLRVRPGITGIWQTSGRSTVPFDEAVRMDLFYIENWSLGTDLFLIGKTVLAVLGRTGAH